jgi:hypothetical protein
MPILRRNSRRKIRKIRESEQFIYLDDVYDIWEDMKIGILSFITHNKCKYRTSCPNFQKGGKYCEGLDYCKCGLFLKMKRGI